MTQEANNQTQQNQTHQTVTGQQPQKIKRTRTRKTIEQELAELEARKQKLLESKRKAEAHEKIIFGVTVIAMLKNMQKNGDTLAKTISDRLKKFANDGKSNDFETVEKIIAPILEIKPEVNPQGQGKNHGSQASATTPKVGPTVTATLHQQTQHIQTQNR